MIAIVRAKMVCTHYRLKLLPLEFSDTHRSQTRRFAWKERDTELI